MFRTFRPVCDTETRQIQWAVFKNGVPQNKTLTVVQIAGHYAEKYRGDVKPMRCAD